MKQLYTLLFCLLCSSPLLAQELAKKEIIRNSTSTRYLVLKNDKSVKHGQYLRTFNVLFYGEQVMELGQYDNNQKTGTWYTFFHESFPNSVESVGTYKNGQFDGPRTNYYELFEQHLADQPAHLPVKRTRITPPEKGALAYTVDVNLEYHITESTGQYSNGKKVGVWKYYDPKGNLTQVYNHTTGETLEDYTFNPQQLPITYVGGMGRFRVLYYAAKSKRPAVHNSITKNSKAIFELEKCGTFRFVSATGNAFIRKHAEGILKTLPNEWVYAEKDTAESGKLQVIIQILKPEIENRFIYTVGFEMVE